MQDRIAAPKLSSYAAEAPSTINGANVPGAVQRPTGSLGGFGGAPLVPEGTDEELYVEGVATRDDPEPCVGVREGTGEASGWARAGRAFEPRNHRVRGADAVYGSGRQHRRQRYCELLVGPARSENQGMYGTFMRENRRSRVRPSG